MGLCGVELNSVDNRVVVREGLRLDVFQIVEGVDLVPAIIDVEPVKSRLV